MAKGTGVCAAITVCASFVITAAQSPQPSFDVASVKENTSGSGSGGIAAPTPGRWRITNTPLRFIVLEAFGLRDHELIGAPDWTHSTAFDITATYAADPARTLQDTRAMLQTLLADRFGLQTHRETRELPIYSLVMARQDGALGPQLVRSTIDCEQWIAEKRPRLGAGSPSPVVPGGKRPVCQLVATRRLISAGTQTMQQLTGPLQSFTGRPVVDRTGLAGAFDFDLQWTSGPVAPAPGAPPAADDGPSIFAALQEQLGLRLEPGRGPFEVVVIDEIHRPTPD
jgi:uncharacterized protein (TIGR03435 family)